MRAGKKLAMAVNVYKSREKRIRRKEGSVYFYIGRPEKNILCDLCSLKAVFPLFLFLRQACHVPLLLKGVL